MNQIKAPRILIYDDKNLEYIEGLGGNFDISSGTIEHMTLDEPNAIRTIPDRDATFQCTINNMRVSEYIKLDETMMRRIAKYNKEVEIEKLNKEIENKQSQIKELDDKLQDREQRWLRVKNYIANIYDMDLSEEDEDDWDWDD